MTGPSPWDSITAGDERDALASITKMMTGTKMLQDEPGVVYSLAAQQAHPADAQAIDQFMQALDAEKQVNVARAAGHPINLTSEQQTMLQANGVHFQDVLYTAQDTAKAAATRALAATGGKETVKTNPDGSLALDKNGQIQPETVKVSKSDSFDAALASGQITGHTGGVGGGGILGSIGRQLDRVVGDTAHLGHDVLSGFGKAANEIQNDIAPNGLSNPLDPNSSPVSDKSLLTNAADVQDMQQQGYDPTSLWSTLAFNQSGRKHTGKYLATLNDTYGQARVDEALQFLSNPAKLKESVLGPDAFVKDAEGHTTMTPEASARIKYWQSDDFQTLVKRVDATRNDVGHEVANAMGLDPMAQPTPGLDGIEPGITFNRVADTTNLIAAFALDPTLLGLKAMEAAKVAKYAIPSLADRNAVAQRLLDTGAEAKAAQRPWLRAIDLTGQMRTAEAAGDHAKLNALTAQYRAEMPPEFRPIMSEFIGKNALVGWRMPTDAEMANGARGAIPVRGETQGIRSLEDAAVFMHDQWGHILMLRGGVPVRAGYMPGSLSTFGVKRLKGITAGWMTARSTMRAEGANAEALTRIGANPALAQSLVDQGLLMRMPASADDAVNVFTGDVIGAKAEAIPLDGSAEAAAAAMPSQARGETYALTPAGKGQIANNLRTRGDVLGQGTALGGLFSPTAIAARSRVAAERLVGTLAPRVNKISLDDPQASDTIRAFGMTYLNRGDTNGLVAAWNFGSDGQRRAIIAGMRQQVAHAAGLPSTASGQNLLKEWAAQEQYSAVGNEIEYDGERLGLFEGQTRTDWTIPSFRELQQAHAKFGLYDATFGRPATGKAADTLMSQWKLGAIGRPATVTRNWLEGWGRTILEGRAGDAVKAKAIGTMRNKDLWALGHGQEDRAAFIEHRNTVDSLDAQLAAKGIPADARKALQDQRRAAKRSMEDLKVKPVVQHLLATEMGDTKAARELERGSLMAGQILGHGITGYTLSNLAPLAWVGRAYHSLVGDFLSGRQVELAMKLGPERLSEIAEGFGQQSLEAMGFDRAAYEATDLTRAGIGPARLRFTADRALERGRTAKKPGSHTIWSTQALDGTQGAMRFAAGLGRMVNKMPETARAVLDHIEGNGSLEDVVANMEKETRHSGFGSVYFEDPVNAPNAARKAVTPEEAEMGKRDWANKVVAEYKHMLYGQNGKYQQKLADYIREHGQGPDDSWIADHITLDNRPERALAPETMPMPNGGKAGFIQAIQDVEGAAFQHFVERQLQRTTSSPVNLANYLRTRESMDSTVEEMISEAGLSRESAEALAEEVSIKNSWVQTEKLIDDPGQRAQFDVVARNLFPFARATNAMLRRWGAGLWQNPVAARKMMLAYEGAQHSGIIYNNAYGEPTFTYPASGVMNMVMREVAKIPGFSGADGVQFPVSGDMTGGVLMAVPGADNPFRMSMGPMLSMPIRYAYEHFLPAAYRGAALKADEAFNGPVGAGEILPQLMPTAVRTIYKNMFADDRNSAMASSMNSAIANLATAGLLPAPNATPAEMQQFMRRLQDQVRNQLYVRAAFGLFAPASPSQPTEETKAGAKTDFAWSVEGVKGLSDEFKSILNEVKGSMPEAMAVWTTMHPDQVLFKEIAGTGKTDLTGSGIPEARSGSTVKGAYLPATDKALDWMTTHDHFIKQYASVAAYFLPTSSANEPFSDAAYKAQIELGLRQKKTPQEFMDDIYVKHAESLFYPANTEWDQKIASAKAAGNNDLATQLTNEKSVWSKQFKALNPLFAAKIDNYPATRSVATGQLADIRKMLSDNAVPDGQAPKLQQLVSTWDNYNKFIADHPGSDAQTKAQHSAALSIFNQWATEHLTGTPLVDVFNGVFQPLNTNLNKLTTGGS